MPGIDVRVIDCWVFRRDASDLSFLIMRRSEGRKYGGIHHCVHGKIRPGEKAWETALRELREETGLTPLRMWTADGMSSFYEAESDTVNLVPVFAVEVDTLAEPILSDEHSSYNWLSASEAETQLAWENHREAIRRIRRLDGNEKNDKKWLEIQFE